MPLTRGLYELLSTEALAEQLTALEPHLHPDLSALRPAEAADRIAQHVARLIQRALETVSDKDRVATGIAVARTLVATLGVQLPNAEVDPDAPEVRGRVLRAIGRRQQDGSLESLVEPLIPLLDTALLTNAPGEPRVGSQIATEIASADRIDIVMAFVRRSGIAPLMEALRKHRDSGRVLRLLTTTYTGSTEARALDELCALGAEVRVSYDTSSTRLHAGSGSQPEQRILLRRQRDRVIRA